MIYESMCVQYVETLALVTQTTHTAYSLRECVDAEIYGKLMMQRWNIDIHWQFTITIAHNIRFIYANKPVFVCFVDKNGQAVGRQTHTDSLWGHHHHQNNHQLAPLSLLLLLPSFICHGHILFARLSSSLVISWTAAINLVSGIISFSVWSSFLCLYSAGSGQLRAMVPKYNLQTIIMQLCCVMRIKICLFAPLVVCCVSIGGREAPADGTDHRWLDGHWVLCGRKVY